MSMSEMSIKERWIAALELREADRLPFWPKISSAYSKRHGENIWNSIQWDRPGPSFNPVKYLNDKCTIKQFSKGENKITEYRTPRGELRMTEIYDRDSCSYHPAEFPVKTSDDIKLLIEYFSDLKPVYDCETEKPSAENGDETFCPVTGIGISPIMDWLQHLAGIEEGHYMLLDNQELVEELFSAMHSVLCEKAKLLTEHTDAELIYMVENTSTTLISPRQYDLYCKKQLKEISDILHDNNKRLGLHMCGYIKDLLPQIKEVRSDAFEALTPPPVANTTLAEARKICPDVCLIGGTGAVTWLKPEKEIIAEIEMRLDELPNHRGVIVTSGGALPPDCSPETIKQVFAWLKKYKPRF